MAQHMKGTSANPFTYPFNLGRPQNYKYRGYSQDFLQWYEPTDYLFFLYASPKFAQNIRKPVE